MEKLNNIFFTLMSRGPDGNLLIYTFIPEKVLSSLPSNHIRTASYTCIKEEERKKKNHAPKAVPTSESENSKDRYTAYAVNPSFPTSGFSPGIFSFANTFTLAISQYASVNFSGCCAT